MALVPVLANDEGFEQRFLLRIVPRPSTLLIKVDPVGSPYRTPAVAATLRAAARILAGPDATVTLAADLWFAPEVNAVLSYEVTAEVSGVHLLWADRAASTVSGTLVLRYALDVAALDTLPNISVPHGC